MPISQQISETPVITPQPGYNTYAEIDTAALQRNIRLLKNQAGAIEIVAVVKADAYGHDIVQLAPRLAKLGIHRFMVATLDEAMQLRVLVPDAQILVASPPHAENLPIYQAQNLDVSVTSKRVARLVIEAAGQGLSLNVHPKIETGMNRLGMPIEDAAAPIQQMLATPGLTVAGLWSHLATASASDKVFAQQQIEKAYAFVDQLPTFDGYFHVGNSGTLLNHRDRIGRRDKELVRLGGAILGIPASQQLAQRLGLTPIMSLKSRVLHTKALQPGDRVSYGLTWETSKPTKIAIVGAGYADGYPSALSNHGSAMIKDLCYPIVGRVCMDMFMVDLGPDNADVQAGDEVILFGGKHITIYDLAEKAGLVHYEICCRIPLRVRRRFV